LELKYVKYEVTDDQIAVVTLNYPPLNLLNIYMIIEIRELFIEIAKDPEVRCVILTGGGPKAFCAGAELGADTSSVIPNEMRSPFIADTFNSFETCPQPVIAAINGYALGGGLEMAMACDFRIAADTAKMGLVEAARGLIASNGGMTRFPWHIGEGLAKMLYFTAEKITAEEALHYGLVQKVVPADELLDCAMEMARKIVVNAPLSISAAKTIMREFRAPLFGAGFEREQIHQRRMYKSHDFAEGVKAFKERRPPLWQSR